MSLVECAAWLLYSALALVVIWAVLFLAVQVGVALWRANRDEFFEDEGE